MLSPVSESKFPISFPISNTFASGYARLSRRQAHAVLLLIALTAVAAVAVTLSPLANDHLQRAADKPGDVDLYRAEVQRIRGGEGYYQAAAAELVARSYPTRSVFNWRTPLPMWLLGKTPPTLGKALIGALALATMLLAFAAMAREVDPRRTDAWRLGTPVLCALLLSGPLLPAALGDLLVMPVLWAGILIALSACCYGVDRPWLGVAFGVTAIFFRELALPYGLLCAAIAWRRGRRDELAAWMFGLAAWAVFYAAHCWCVSQWIEAGARSHRQGWIQLGGAGFVISTVQMNAYLLLLPQWVTALYLTAAMVGFAGWNTPLGVRIGLSVCLFLVFLAAVGQSFNQYWGCLTAPLLCFGVTRFPASICDLCLAARFADSRDSSGPE
jgi:hypothetical protein